MTNFCSICKLDDDDEDNFFYHRFSVYIYCIIYINIYIYKGSCSISSFRIAWPKVHLSLSECSRSGEFNLVLTA